MPKRPAADPPDRGSAPRPRPARPVDLARIRAANPGLDDVQGPRAALLPAEPAVLRRHLDGAVDLLSGAAAPDPAMGLIERESDEPRPPTELQLYSIDDSPELLAAAVWAGFFCFGSPYELPGRNELDRGLLNLELGGPAREPSGEDPGGRIVLDLSSGCEQLVVGKRATKSVRPVVAAASGGGDGGGGGGGGGPFAYRLSVNEAFDRSWQAIIDCHGFDWLGFRQIRSSYDALHRKHPCPWQGHAAADEPRVLSIELWDTETGALVSAEVGCLVGACYSCLSLFANTAAYPRCDQVRATAGVLLLRKAGVTLFDAGTTAGYYITLFGFRRTSRKEFVALWREHRGHDLDAGRAALHTGCADVRRLLDASRGASNHQHQEQQQTPAVAADAASRQKHPQQKPSVKVDGLPQGTTAADLSALFASCGTVTKATVVGHKGFGVLLFTEQAGAAAALALNGTSQRFGTAGAGTAGVVVSVTAGAAKKAKNKRA
eukprot:SAG22_NODE_83_length_21704_cov_58.556584_8_plen_490_part_00